MAVERALTLRQRLQAILDGEDPVYGRAVALVIQALIVTSSIAIAVETLPDLPPVMLTALTGFEIVVVSIFTVEYAARLYAAPNRLRYATSPFGIIDLLSILPTLLLLGYELHALRALRILRVLRLLKLARYIAALDRLGRALRAVLDELIVFAGIAAVVLYLCAAAIYWFENAAQPDAYASIFHAMWWAVVTLTTVGYGDVYPITVGGRIFTGLMLLVALGVIAVPTGLVATALSDERNAEHRGEGE
jgi:voltage-gated potassium channel